MRYREKKDLDHGLDISPLIDIVFILLIFFMVSTTFVKDMQLDINRPDANSATVSSTKAVRLYVDQLGDIYLDGEPIRMWLIQSKLRDMLRTSTTKSVLVIADDSVPSGQLVEVVDQARMGGAKNVGVATQKEAG